MKRRFVYGFTLVELLVVIAIIGVLVALLLPAVQAAREAARRGQCANNMTQISLALHNYEMAHGCYPPGTIDATGPIVNAATGYHHNWLVQILPYIEEQNAWNSLDKKLSVYHPKNKPVVDAMPRWLLCPSCGAGFGNFIPCYAACHHEKEKQIDAKDHGVFFLNSFVRYDDITDGSSHTIFVGEKLPDAWDLHWLSGTRTSLRNTGTPIGWLTYGAGLPRPGGPTMPPQMQTIPNLEDDSDDPAAATVGITGGAPSRELAAIASALDPASVAPGKLGASTAPDDAAAAAVSAASAGDVPSSNGSSASPTSKKLAVLPGNPAFVGGFASEHPNVAIFAMGDGSIKALTRGMSGKVLQAFAHKSDGKLDTNW